MNKTRLAHIATLLGIALAQLQFVWMDQQADLSNKICNSLVALLTLIFVDPTQFAFARTITSIIASLVALTVSQLLTKGTFGTAATGVLTTTASVFARLPAALYAAPTDPSNVIHNSEDRRPKADEKQKSTQDDVS
jgi:hypothetical protein